jgi:hypothetical protein
MESWYWAVAIVTCAIAALIHTVVSSLILHPLAKFPGPKYAAVSHYYQFYYDVLQRGRFPWKLKSLHQSYGERER